MRDYVGMSVREMMEAEPETYVKIGSSEGCGFIFCGQFKDFIPTNDHWYKIQGSMIKDRLEGALESYERLKNNKDKICEDLIRMYKQYKNDTDENKKIINIYEKFINHDDKSKLPETYEEYICDIEVPRRINSAYRRYVKLSKAIEDYKPILDRPIIDQYNSQLLNTHNVLDCIIIFPGVESGFWWDLEEYERGWIISERGDIKYRERY